MPAATKRSMTCCTWCIEQLSSTTIERAFSPSKGSICGMSRVRTKSKNTSPLTDPVVMSTATTPVDAIAAIAEILPPLWSIPC